MSDPRMITPAEQDQRGQRPADDDRPGQQGSAPSGERPREREEPSNLKKPARPETLPPSTTSGGLPSEPGWMRS